MLPLKRAVLLLLLAAGSACAQPGLWIPSGTTIKPAIDKNLALHDSNASHLVSLLFDNHTSDHSLTLTLGDANRTLTFSGNPTLSDWFDQSVKQAGSPTFAGVTLGNTGLHLLDTNASHDMIVACGSNITADRTVTLTIGNSDRTITLNGDPTLNDWFDQSVKEADNPTFAALYVNGDIGLAYRLNHIGDGDTFFEFTTNNVEIWAGNEEAIDCTDTVVTINPVVKDMNFIVASENLNNMFVVDASADAIGINNSSPGAMLDIETSATDTIGQIIRYGQASQTVDMLQVIDESTNELFVIDKDGNIEVSQYVHHLGDVSADTNMEFAEDNIELRAGTVVRMSMVEGGSDYVVFNEGGYDVDFRVEGTSFAHTLFVEGSSDNVGIHNPSPGAQLDIATSATGTIGQIIRYGQASQTAHMLQIMDESTGKLFVIDKDGYIQVPSGAAATPSIAYMSDGNTGMYFTEDRIYMSANGNEVLDININRMELPAGNIIVGQGAIGTTPDATTLGGGATALAVDNCVVTVTDDGDGNVIGTITGGVSGQLLTLIFVNADVTITDTDVAAPNTVDLAGTATDFTSADDKVLQLVFDGTSWFEVSRSVN